MRINPFQIIRSKIINKPPATAKVRSEIAASVIKANVNPAFEFLQTKGFHVLSKNSIASFNHSFINLMERRPSGFMISPLTGDMILSDLYQKCKEENIEIPYNLLGGPLPPVKCSLFEFTGDNRWDSLWHKNIFPIMGEGIYHNNGKLFSQGELANAGFRQIVDEQGAPVYLHAFASGNRVVSIPGPWIVPYTESSNGIEIIETKMALESIYGKVINDNTIENVLVELFEQKRINLKLASDMQFKGAGCHQLFSGNFDHYRGQPIYYPFFQYARTGRLFVGGGIGAAEKDENDARVIEKEIRNNGGNLLADTVSAKMLFNKDNSNEFQDAGELNDVWMSLRLNYNTYRMRYFIDRKSDDGPPSLVRHRILSLYLEEMFGSKDHIANNNKYYELSLTNLARNIKAATPSSLSLEYSASIPDNFGPLFEMIDTSSIIDSPQLFVSNWIEPFDMFQAVYLGFKSANCPIKKPARNVLDSDYYHQLYEYLDDITDIMHIIERSLLKPLGYTDERIKDLMEEIRTYQSKWKHGIRFNDVMRLILNNCGKGN